MFSLPKTATVRCIHLVSILRNPKVDHLVGAKVDNNCTVGLANRHHSHVGFIVSRKKTHPKVGLSCGQCVHTIL